MHLYLGLHAFRLGAASQGLSFDHLILRWRAVGPRSQRSSVTSSPASAHTEQERNEYMVAWNHVTRAEVLRAMKEYDRLGPERFFSEHGFAPTTTYELVWEGRSYPPKAILGTAYEFATGQRLGSSDFEGGKTGAVRVLGQLGFTIKKKRRPAR